ncbi:MAG: CBS domain-containing protein [Acidimicrobiales bacterium]
MLIERIVREKGAEVATIGADAPVSAAVAELRRWNVGALVVTGESGPVEGIVSERDIVRAIADDGLEALDTTVGAIMSSGVVTCDRQSTVEDLMRIMTERRIRHVPIVEGSALVGIVSIGDVVKSRLGELETETRSLVDYISSGR